MSSHVTAIAIDVYSAFAVIFNNTIFSGSV